MSNTITLSKLRRPRRIVAGLLGAAALTLGVATTASAATITTPSSPYSVGMFGGNVTVTGTADTPGNYVALGVCNVTVDPLGGTACKQFNNEVVQSDPSTGAYSITINAPLGFTNYNLQTGAASGGMTLCDGWLPGDQCAIQASEYSTWPPMGPPTPLAPATLLLDYV